MVTKVSSAMTAPSVIISQIARSLNVLDSQVVYSTDTVTVLDDVLYIYDASAQVTWGIPSLDSTGKTIVSVVGSALTTTGGTGGGSYTLISQEKSDLKLTMSEAVVSTTIKLGDSIRITDRDDGIFDVVLAASVTANTFDVVQCTGVATLALALRIGDVISMAELGAALDYTALIDDTPVFERAQELANPTPENTHSISDSKTIEFYGKPLINGQIVMREGVTLRGVGYGSIIMCGWSTSVWDKIVSYQKVSTLATKNFALENFQIAPNYDEDGTAILSDARLIYLDNVIEPKIDAVRCIQHLQATSQPNAVNLPITGLETRRCSSLDMPNITFDGGQYGWTAGYSGTGGGSLNARVGSVFAFNQQMIGVNFGAKTSGNIIQSIESYVESDQGGGSRVGLRLDGSDCTGNVIKSSSFGGPAISAGFQMQNSAAFNRISGDSTADCSIGGINNRIIGFFGALYDAGSSNEYIGSSEPSTYGSGMTILNKSGTKTDCNQRKAYTQELLIADVDNWVDIAGMQMEENNVSIINVSVFGSYGGVARVTSRKYIINRAGTGVATITEDTGSLYQLNSVDRVDIRVVADVAAGSVKVQVKRLTLMGVGSDMDTTVKIDLDFDKNGDSLSYVGMYSI